MSAKNGSPPIRRRGFALVVALIAVVLVTVLILAFFSKAILNRQVSFSSASQIQAGLIAGAAMEMVTGELRQEIADFSQSPAPGVFLPQAAANMLPIRSGVTNADASVGQFTIAKLSSDTRFSQGSGSLLQGSPVRLDQPSRNSRNHTRWFVSGPGLGSANLPAWTYFTRNGVFTGSPNPAVANDPTRQDFVLGRFSFAVYNTGGLLNANVAGFPSTAPAARVRAKGSLAYADLTALGISQSQINTLVSWRNSRSGTNAATFDQWATGIPGASPDPELLDAPASGFTRIARGDNAFLSRRDLMRYLTKERFPTNAISALSHTSRSLNAPSWGPSNVPGSSIHYGDNANDEGSINRSVAAVKAYNGTMRIYADDGTFEEVTVTENDPLVRTRFSLAKLAWLGHNGPNVAAFHPSLTSNDRRRAILDCFGLRWSAGGGGSSSNARWEYNHGNPNDIMILSEVRREQRAPDFFELLKAGILRGSLGGEPGTATTSTLDATSIDAANGPIGMDFEAYSADQDRHILQIGANIVDQADANNYPTAIHMELINKYSGSERDFFNTVFGVENLPLLQRIGLLSTMAASAPDGVLSPMDSWLQPELWNPHEKSTARTANHTDTPRSLRLVTYGSVRLNHLRLNPETNFSDRIDFGNDFENPNPQGIVYFTNPEPDSNRPENFFDRPRQINKGPGLSTNYSDPTFPTLPQNGRPPNMDGAGAWDFLGVYVGQVQHDPAVNQLEIAALIPVGNSMSFVLEYYDGTSWRPYNAISRVVAIRSNSGVGDRGGSSPMSWSGHPDPRTQRFSALSDRPGSGAQLGWPRTITFRPAEERTVNQSAGSRGRSGVRGPRPRESSAFFYNPFSHHTGNFYLLDSWAENVEGSAISNDSNNNYYRDPDGVVRPGDAWRNAYLTGEGMMLYHYDNQPISRDRRRPVILNRPFRSVGELSYVFRDLPFKALDFWSDKSADAGLLDLFSASAGSPIVASQININATTPSALAAVISGSEKQSATTDTIPLPLAQELAQTISRSSAQLNRAALGSTMAHDIFTTLTTDSASSPRNPDFRNKSYGEAPVRALAELSTTRSWNFLVDVVAQSGRLAVNASTLADFIVEGERRYWLHVAIDRFTGEVIHRQLEPVLE